MQFHSLLAAVIDPPTQQPPGDMGGPLYQSGVNIDIRGQKEAISKMTEFAPTIEGLIRGLFVFAGLMTFFYMLYGAFEWITAGGESGKIEAARKKITHAVVGLVLLASTAAFFMVIQYFLGINILNGGVSGGSTGGTGVTCAGGVAIGSTLNDGGAGNYCNANGQPTAAMVQCVGPGEGPSKFPYAHFEPMSCVTGTKSYNW